MKSYYKGITSNKPVRPAGHTKKGGYKATLEKRSYFFKPVLTAHPAARVTVFQNQVFLASP